MKKKNITAILLVLTVFVGCAAGCGDSNVNMKETGEQMNTIQEETNETDFTETEGESKSEDSNSDGELPKNHANPIGSDLEQLNEDLKEKVNSFVENTEKLIEEKKEGN